jgi:hypothetical protein
VAFSEGRDDLQANMGNGMLKAVKAYAARNGKPPAKVILFRDGVGEGHIGHLLNTEIPSLKVGFNSFDCSCVITY